jgi:hypothetical protein
MSASDIDKKIDTVASDIRNLLPHIADDEDARKRLLEVVQQALGAVEAPVETIWRMIMSPHAPAALNAIIRMGVLTELAKAGTPKSAKELATLCNADELLIVRLMRPLVALGVFRETDAQTYETTPVSQTLTAPPLIGGYQFM